MGKSTLTKWISKKAIEQNLAIPILIELRNLKENHTILDEIYLQINPIDKTFDSELILKFIELGNFLIVLDGFDEIQLKNQDLIIKDVRDFINKAPNNWYLLTSRPEGSLAAFGDFQLFNIKTLSVKDSYQLIEKYDSISSNKISKNLISSIKQKINQVRTLLGNPFLVSLLYSTYTYNKDIPASRVSFYEEIYSALFKKHDLSKDGWTRPKKSNLDIQQFRVLLRQLAFDTSILGETSYLELQLTELVNEARKKCLNVPVAPNDFVEDLLSTVPLFQRDGTKIRWAHKSLQDFFASEYIAFDTDKEAFLEAIYNNSIDSFNNILEFLVELDYKTFRRTLIRRLLTDFIRHYENSYKDFDTAKIGEKEIETRKCKTFGVTYYIRKGSLKELKEITQNLKHPYSTFPNYEDYKDKSLLFAEDYFILSVGSVKLTIIKALASTNIAFIKDIRLNNAKSHPKKISNEICELTDDPSLTFNSKMNFSKTNDILQFHSRNVLSNFEFPVIDYLEAKKEIAEIEKDIESHRTIQAFTLFKKQ